MYLMYWSSNFIYLLFLFLFNTESLLYQSVIFLSLFSALLLYYLHETLSLTSLHLALGSWVTFWPIVNRKELRGNWESFLTSFPMLYRTPKVNGINRNKRNLLHVLLNHTSLLFFLTCESLNIRFIFYILFYFSFKIIPNSERKVRK